MKPRCISILVMVVLMASPLTARAQATVPSEVAHVDSLEAARRTAMVAGDVKTLADLIAADATYVHSTGLIQRRDELFSMLERGDIRYVSFTVDVVEYRTYGDTVIGTGVQNIELTSAGKPFTSRSRYTVVYAPTGGDFRMVAYQSTSLPEIVTHEQQ